MVSRHGQDPAGERIEKAPRVAELRRLRALREVARDDDDVRTGFAHAAREGYEELRIDATEVQVGEMGECPHGVITRSARGRTR